MTLATQGSPVFPHLSGSQQVSSREEIDHAIQTLQSQKDTWARLSVHQRIILLEELTSHFAALAERWVTISREAKGISDMSFFAGEEWALGPWPILRNLRQLRQSLSDIETYGRPRIPGPVHTRSDGQVVAQVFPQTSYDRLFFTGIHAEIWMEPGVTEEGLAQTQALAYQEQTPTGKVALVLGAGNVSSIGPLDILYKLFIENQVTIIKMNPVNAYLGPLIEEGFRPLVQQGFLAVSYGGASEGAYLCNHPGIDEIHITGSDKTFDAIVFGTGPEGARRKAEGRPLLQKRVTGELGNVSPLIIVPGPWSATDLSYQAEHIVSSLTTNAGFNCNATRVIIQQSEWTLREQLLKRIREILAQVPIRAAYYPGAQDRHRSFTTQHPEAELIGASTQDQLPWTLIAGVDPEQADDVCFTTEAFCGLFAETTLKAANTVDYLDQVVTFANERLWGSLNITLLVHPTTLKEPGVAEAVERALSNLRYGTIGLNYWAGGGYALGVTPWGAFPGHELSDIQSGNGVVHNTLMFSRPQKSILRAPFRSIPTPPWFATRGKAAARVFPLLTDMEAAPSWWKVPAIIRAAL